jgi:acyl CoA:acetate/3-ketoacid CoA transferase beta subunit
MILSGAGSRGVAAFVAYYRLRAEGYEVDLITGNGQVGFTPLPGVSILSTEAGIRTCTMLTDTIMAQGVLIGGRNNKCLSVLGAGQIDKHGNINSTVTSGGQFLVGSGGANDAMNAREVIVALDQSKDRFVETLPYVTGRGDGVTTVVSTMAIFRKPDPGGELQLASCLPLEGGRSTEENMRAVQESCGWPLATGARVGQVAAPEQGELDLLRWLLSTPSS